MSLKLKGLGRAASAVIGHVISSFTNPGTAPMVLTLANAYHGIKSGDRVGIDGATETSLNGDSTIVSKTGATATLDRNGDGSGTTVGSAFISQKMDVTPFMKGHSAVAMIEATVAHATASDPTGTVQIQGGATPADASFASVMNEENNGFDLFKSDNLMVEVDLAAYMRMKVTAYTDGMYQGWLLA
jgi:hypothetical protein